MINLNSRIGAQYPFTFGFVCQGTNSGRNEVFETSSTGNIPSPLPTDVFTVNGANCEIIAHAFSVYSSSLTSGNFIHVLNGGTMRASAGRCKNLVLDYT